MRLPGDLPEIIADKRSLSQIMLNLLSNAIKFSQRGGTVTVSATAEGGSIAVTVADTGVGIGADDLPRIGDPFFQARSSYDRRHDGTGLGLSIVKGLVALHGGQVEHSEPARGGDAGDLPHADRLPEWSNRSPTRRWSPSRSRERPIRLPSRLGEEKCLVQVAKGLLAGAGLEPARRRRGHGRRGRNDRVPGQRAVHAVEPKSGDDLRAESRPATSRPRPRSPWPR